MRALVSTVIKFFPLGWTVPLVAGGYAAGDWQMPGLLIPLFWIGTVFVSIVFAVACRRQFILPPVLAPT
jgi:hypothetical protein